MSLPNDPKYECVMNTPPVPRLTHNNVHTLKDRSGDQGLEIKCNWRWLGIGGSWGDTSIHRLSENGKYEMTVAWFAGIHLGPLFLVYAWPKQAVK